jgi:hypothetical protein
MPDPYSYYFIKEFKNSEKYQYFIGNLSQKFTVGTASGSERNMYGTGKIALLYRVPGTLA